MDDVRAVALVLPDGAAFSHQTAAQLLGLPIPQRLHSSKPLHVTVLGQRGSRKAVTWHKASIAGHVMARGLPVTDAERTWLDLGNALTVPEAVAVADAILRRGYVKVLSVPDGIRGAVCLRCARELADPRSQSPKESILRAELHLAGLPKPEVNLDVYEHGDWVGRGDLVWCEYRLYVEYDLDECGAWPGSGGCVVRVPVVRRVRRWSPHRPATAASGRADPKQAGSTGVDRTRGDRGHDEARSRGGLDADGGSGPGGVASVSRGECGKRPAAGECYEQDRFRAANRSFSWHSRFVALAVWGTRQPGPSARQRIFETRRNTGRGA
jgi:hypothetical protein